MASKIKVDNIENQCGGAVVTKCGATTTISGSVVKANDIQAADGGNLINQCGTTITLGASGDTITLACGASQTGFGRTGTVDWDTTAKTASFTAVSGTGYFVNTTSGAITVTLPATPSAGDIVAVSDYAATSITNNITIARNGSNIEGSATDLTIENNGIAMTFVYVDGTRGWKTVNAGQKTDNSSVTYMEATGGTVTCCGDYKIHTFTSPGTFCVSQISNTAVNNEVSYIVIAGGGGGGQGGGGGGAGGFRESKSGVDCYSASPLEGSTNITVTATAFPITVGSGGSGSTSTPVRGSNGSNSVFSTVTSAGGGGAGSHDNVGGNTGGSGGGNGNGSAASGGAAVSGNTPPVSPPQGQPGGASANPNGAPAFGGSGGGGAGAAGGASSTTAGGAGGNGVSSSITGSVVTRSGGGGGSVFSGCNQGAGGSGGGGAGGPGSCSPYVGTAGTANTGGGGGGGGNATNCAVGNGANGGSGIVIIRYKYQ